ncbi:hypothetical protein BMS3Abin07_00846 [bacterium BMS3Abin07]|nr:hypothetical protein BMS3Abin07_00846 [bacterium BMS3Abin07]GBE33037.1 hypothetical protein BMS3Bbin05_01969 [bacterium BMS3Bbin05]
MVAGHMQNGFLENIIDMFKHDPALYSMLPHLIADERLVVRIGTTALIETLNEEDRNNVQKAVPLLMPLLLHGNPNIRGDVANILGIISDSDISGSMEPLLHDNNVHVRVIAKEAIEEIKERISGGS